MPYLRRKPVLDVERKGLTDFSIVACIIHQYNLKCIYFYYIRFRFLGAQFLFEPVCPSSTISRRCLSNIIKIKVHNFQNVWCVLFFSLSVTHSLIHSVKILTHSYTQSKYSLTHSFSQNTHSLIQSVKILTHSSTQQKYSITHTLSQNTHSLIH